MSYLTLFKHDAFYGLNDPRTVMKSLEKANNTRLIEATASSNVS